MNQLERINHNARQIKTIIAALVGLCGLVYGFCIFIYQAKQCSIDLLNLKADIAVTNQENMQKHKEIEARILQNEKNFQMNSAKLDVSLTEIRSDLRFIKEHLIRKGLDK